MAIGLCMCVALTGTDTAPLSLNDIHIRDPFVLPVPSEGTYYLYGTLFPLPDGPGFAVYESRDLEMWTPPRAAFRRPPGFWSDRDYWAPEVHAHSERYYLFASFKAEKACRGTQVLVADSPRGPFRLHSDGPVTPRGWECLDGTLFVDGDGRPWMVFCHEWVQVGDGEMCALPLSPELDRADGPPQLLFHASDAPWVHTLGQARRGKITDGPFLYRASNGALLMLWSSFGEGGYAVAVARSVSGALAGPWTHDPKPLRMNDGGHPMLFRDFAGHLRLSIHEPNRGGRERPKFLRIEEQDGVLTILPE